MLASLDVTELEQPQPGTWKVRLSFQKTFRECLLQDPFVLLNGCSEAELLWALEDHATLDPYDKRRSKEVSTALQKYGASLAQQLDILGIFKGYEHILGEMDIVLMDIQDLGNESTFMAIRWETIEHACKVDLPRMPRIVVRRQIQNEAGTSSMPPIALDEEQARQRSRGYNILVVISRPSNKDDIDPFITVRVLNFLKHRRGTNPEQFEKVDADFRRDYPSVPIQCLDEFFEVPGIHFEVSRLGSWFALKHHLRSRTKQWHYQGGTGPWFDLVHFDVHGALWRNEAHLIFLDSSGTKALWKSATKVGKLLRKHQVPYVLLSSCNSAKVTKSPLSNLARILIEYGVTAVTAMSFRFTAAAANMFMFSFYTRLFLTPGPPDILSALLAGRFALWINPQRTGLLGVEPTVEDHIVPVFYFSEQAKKAFWPWRRISGSDYKLMNDVEVRTLCRIESLCKNWLERPNSLELGRQQDILELERLFLAHDSSNVVLLTGFVGVGKSRFAHLLVTWWLMTSFIYSGRYISFREKTSQEVVEQLLSLKDSSGSRNVQRRLFIIDDVDLVTNSTADLCLDGSGLKSGDKQTLANVARDLIGGQDLFIFISRHSEEWLGIPPSQCYILSGLSNFYSSTLASASLQASEESEEIDLEFRGPFADFINSRLMYNPLAIKSFVDGMKPSGKAWPSLSEEFSSAENFFRFLSASGPRSIVYIDYEKFPVARECTEFIERLLSSGSTEARTILVFLSPCTSNFHHSWIDHVLSPDRLESDTDKEEYTRDMSETWNRLKNELFQSGWMESFEVSLPSGEVEQYMRLHPIFTNVLRWSMLVQEADWYLLAKKDVWAVFSYYHLLRAAQYRCFTIVNEHKQPIWSAETHAEGEFTSVASPISITLRAQVESANYLQAFAHLVQDKRLDAARVVIVFLWKAAMSSNTPALSVEMLLNQMVNLYSFEKRQCFQMERGNCAVQPHLDAMVELSTLLAAFYIQKSPRMACEITLETIKLAQDVSGPMESWTSYFGRDMVHLFLASGLCLTQLGVASAKAKECFLFALRLLIKFPEPCVGLFSIFTAAFGLSLTAYTLDEGDDIEDTYYDIGTISLIQLLASRRKEFWSTNPQEFGMYYLNKTYGYGEEKNLVLLLRYIRRTDPDQARLSALKSDAIAGISRGRLNGNKSLEYEGHLVLAELAIENRDWDVADTHIENVLRLRDKIYGGPVPYNSPDDRRFFWARYGCVALVCGRLSKALALFEQSKKPSMGREFRNVRYIIHSPWALIESVKNKTRKNLALLVSAPKKLITLKQYYEFDDAMQALLLQELKVQFPLFDAESVEVRNALSRLYVIDESRVVSVKDPSKTTLGEAFLNFVGLDDSELKHKYVVKDDSNNGLLANEDEHDDGSDSFELKLLRFDNEFPCLTEVENLLNAFLCLRPLVDPIFPEEYAKAIIDGLGGDFEKMKINAELQGLDFHTADRRSNVAQNYNYSVNKVIEGIRSLSLLTRATATSSLGLMIGSK